MNRSGWLLLLSVLCLCGAWGLACSTGGGDDDDDDASGDGDGTPGPMTDNGDGTATDPATGLMWENPPGDSAPGAELDWYQAMSYCDLLTLGEQSDWRLPSIDELRSLVRGCPATQTGGACDLTDDCLTDDCRTDVCFGCNQDAGPANGCYWDAALAGTCGYYWSSSLRGDEGDGPHMAWYLQFGGAAIVSGNQGNNLFGVRCVRP